MKKRGNWNKSGQVWLETGIYTLIAFTLIGLVLGYAKPKIEEMQDRAIIEQSVEILKGIKSTISSIGTAGNQRIVEILINKGILKIDGKNNKIIMKIESRAGYSEAGQTIEVEGMEILTEKLGDLNLVTLTTNYGENYNITYENQDIIKLLNQAKTSYKLSIENRGFKDNKTLIELKVI